MSSLEFHLFWITLAPSFYGFMYVIWLFSGYYIVKKRKFIENDKLDNLLFYIFLWIILGWRIGYILFYNLPYYLSHLSEIPQVWKGGMSFHGGALWVIIACLLFTKYYKISFYKIIDEVAYVSTIGLFFGRIWNYYNKELLGFHYDGPLAIIKDGVGYFPTPILEATLEGLFLFVILSYFNSNKKFEWQVWSLFLILYGLFRLWVELWFRMPDEHLGYIYGPLSLGAILSICMIIAGIIAYMYLWFKNEHGSLSGKKKSKKKK